MSFNTDMNWEYNDPHRRLAGIHRSSATLSNSTRQLGEPLSAFGKSRGSLGRSGPITDTADTKLIRFRLTACIVGGFSSGPGTDIRAAALTGSTARIAAVAPMGLALTRRLVRRRLPSLRVVFVE